MSLCFISMLYSKAMHGFPRVPSCRSRGQEPVIINEYCFSNPYCIATAAPCARAGAKGGKKNESPMPKVPNRVRRATLAVSKAYG